MTDNVSSIGYAGFNPYAMAQQQQWLYSQYANDFGLGGAPGYNMNMQYTMPGMYGMGMPGMYGGMGMGMGMYPQFAKSYIDYVNMTPIDRLSHDHEYNQAAREYNAKDSKNAKQHAVLGDGMTGDIDRGVDGTVDAIINGQTDKISRQFERIVIALKTSPLYDKLKADGSYSEHQIEEQIRKAAMRHFQAGTGQDITQMIDEHCDGAVKNGFLNTLTFGSAQVTSKEETKSKILGTDPPSNIKALKNVGKVGGATAYAAAGAVAGTVISGIVSGAAAGSFVPGLGTAIGAGVGLVIGIVGAICGSR